MSRTNIFLFSIVFLAFICSQSNAFLQFGGALRNTIMNAHANSSGIINLKTDSYNQFFVEADFSYYYGARNFSNTFNDTNSTNSTNNFGSNPETGRMMISLVNSETMVASSCSNFYSYDCSSSTSCTKYSNTKSIDYPTFTATTQYAQSRIYLDYNYWSISSNYLYIAFSCSTNNNLGGGMYGVLGLGTGNGGSSNFGYSPIFSIFINSDLTAGKLLFKSDTSTYAQSSNYVNAFFASPTWQISTSNAYIRVGTSSLGFSGNIMFDINSNAIGLPQNTYNFFLTYFGYLPGVYCYSGYTSRPYCYATKPLSDLPDLALIIGGSQIKIPSAIYASPAGTSGSYNYFYLNFKATSPYLSGVNYVSSAFQNSTILDAHFMSYYYVVFDATNGYNNYIYLYPSINSGESSPAAKWIGSGALLAMLLIGLCCCCAKKNRGVASTVTATAAPLNNTVFNNTTQVVYTQPAAIVTTVPTYSYDANQYNYAGYNNIQQQPQGALYQPYSPQGYAPPANFQGNTQ